MSKKKYGFLEEPFEERMKRFRKRWIAFLHWLWKRYPYILIFIIFSFSIVSLSNAQDKISTYAAIGFDGSHNFGFEAGMIFRAKMFAKVSNYYLSYSEAWISSADKVEANNGRQFTGLEIVFRKLRDNIYAGAGESYSVVDTYAWTKQKTFTIGALLWYPAAEQRIMFLYQRENNGEVSGCKAEYTYLFLNNYTIDVWAGFYSAQGRAAYTFGASIGMLLF